MKKHGWTFAWIAAILVGALLCIFKYEGPGLLNWGNRLKLGIDLSGGTILVYQVKTEARTDSTTLDALIGALKRRINPEGVQDIPIRKIGSNQVEIILANQTPEEVDRLKRKITEVGALEFRILATHKNDQTAIARIDRATSDDQRIKQPPAGYRWVRIGESISGGKGVDGQPVTGAQAPEIAGPNSIKLPGRALTPNRYREAQLVLTGTMRDGRQEESRAYEIESNTEDVLTLTTPHGMSQVAGYTLSYNPSEIRTSGQTPPLPIDPVVRDWNRGNGMSELYVLVEEPKTEALDVTGEHLMRVFPTQDERLQPAVGFVFDATGARKFGRLTGSHLPEEGGNFQYRLAVVLDDMVRSAPSIRSEIRDTGIIEGVPAEEVPLLIEILQSGSLPASIDPTPVLEEKVGPTLGGDTIAKGLFAIKVSMFVVPIFMMLYYHLAGVVAVICLIMNMLLLVASMAVTSSSFTLPGLAGLALTIGMAVDANVLIFERMREEKERGATAAQQVRNGFDRAWSTIFDSNITTILSGLVLWFVGTEEVKGFALTLILGLLWNLFTAVFVSRQIFEFILANDWVKNFSMMKLFGKTSFDFVGPRRYFMAASAVVILAGLALAFSRGQSLYNIDFTGGTLVSIRLAETGQVNGTDLSKMTPAARSQYVRSTAGDVLNDVAVETITLGNVAEKGYRFNIRTTEQSVAKVQDAVIKAFGSSLDSVKTSVSQPQPIASPAPLTAEKPPGEAAPAAQPAERFAGGSRYDLQFSRGIDPQTVRDMLASILQAQQIPNPQARYEVESSTVAPESATRLTLRTDLPADQASTALKSLTERVSTDPSLLFDRLENFGGAVAGETRSLAIVAIVLSWLIIIAYLWFRFKSFSYGLAAVIALVHDVLITLGAVSLSPYKIDLPMVAAFLTLIGFSVNDTIVIFDRIREIKGKSPNLTPQLVNDAINQTLSRTFLTALTAWLVVVIFYLFGGEGLRGFSFCLVVGLLSGTYSTIYIAAPILIEWAKGQVSSAPKGKAVPAGSPG